MSETAKQRLSFQEKLCSSAFFCYLNKRKNSVTCILFVIAALVQGVFYAYKLPFAQVPDELAHYEMMEEEFGTTGYTNELISRLYYPAGLNNLPRNYNAKVNVDAYEQVAYDLFSKPISLSSFHPRITIIRHLPCGIGFYLGIAMDLPMSWCVILAEIFSVLFYVAIGYLTLRITPIKKDIFAFCLLIPQTLHMCASVNYDAVLIPVSMLLFAYILKLFYSDEKVRWRNILIVLFLSVILLIVKPPYVLLALALFIIPLRQFELKIGSKFDLAVFVLKYRIPLLILAIAVGAAGLFLCRNISIVKVVLSDIFCLPKFISLLIRSFFVQGNLRIIQTVGMFGWHDSQVSTMFIIIFFVMLTYLNSTVSETGIKKMTAARRIWLVFVFAVIFLVIEIVFQRWTYDYFGWDLNVGLEVYKAYIPEINTILGVQGRYWIPILPLLLIGISGQAERKSKVFCWTVQIAYYAFAFYSVMNVLNLRYWN